MPIQIDDASISEWHPKYDEIEDDECEYQALVERVRAEGGNISKKTFLRIWNWKGATRLIRFASIYVEGQLTKANKPEEDQYESLYASAFRKAATLLPEQKLHALFGGTSYGLRQRGFGALLRGLSQRELILGTPTSQFGVSQSTGWRITFR